MGQAIDIFRLSGKKYPIYILASTFSTVSLGLDKSKVFLWDVDLISQVPWLWRPVALRSFI